MGSDKSVILPCYNEADNIPHILQAFAEAIGLRTDLEVVLVDNGSSDHTQEVMTEQLARSEYAFARSVRVEVNQGYGFGILEGLRSCTTPWRGWTHADMQTPPADVLKGFDLLTASPQPALLKGRRRGRKVFDALFTSAMSLISSVALGVRLSDVNAQPKLFPSAFFDVLDHPPNDFSLDLFLLYTAQVKEMPILEMDVFFNTRQYGEAKGGGSFKGKVTLIRRTWAYIFELKRNVR